MPLVMILKHSKLIIKVEVYMKKIAKKTVAICKTSALIKNL